MTDYCTNTTIVNGIICIEIKERILQDRRRENDLIERRVVVSIYRIWCHKPLHTIYCFTQFFQLFVIIECRSVQYILCIVIFSDYQAAVVFPFVRITDFLHERVQLGHRFFFGHRAHPVQLLNALAKCNLQVVHQLQHFFFSFRFEVFVYIQLAQLIADVTIDHAHNTLPARSLLFLSAHRFAIKLKAQVFKLLAQVRRHVTDGMEQHILFPGGNRCCRQLFR
ncbi:hypothetical protein D3C86_1419720 [compost metagenome]